MAMNKVQQKHFDKINQFLNQFEAKIKDGMEYVHSSLNITIVNKYGIEKTLHADSVKRISKNSSYWTFDDIMNDHQRNELERIKKIAESKGGKLLSKIYIDCDKKLEFEDRHGNKFSRVAKEVLKNKWSPFESKRVYNNPEYHLNVLRQIAKKRGGKLISTEYVNGNTKLEVEDKNKMRFFMRATDLKRNHWSPYESETVREPDYHLNILREIAKKRGGRLISTVYINAHSKLEWEDSQKRRFFMAATDVKKPKESWSPYESGNVYNNPVYHLNELKKIAKSKGGKLISTEYISAKTKMEFENMFGRRFYCTSNQIKRGVWSHFEIINISEERCRQCIEFIFGQKFQNVWGIIKSSKTNKNMQFDGYNENLKIAFEYQGQQHYYWEYCRGKTENTKKKVFNKIKENDKEKLKLSNKQNIFLIRIKYFDKCKEDNQYLEHVIKELKLLNSSLINNYLSNVKNKTMEFKIDYNKLPTNQKYLDPLIKIAESKGGKLISTQYINNNTKLEFEDKNGNRFFRKPVEVKDKNNPRWSPFDNQQIRVPEYQFNILKTLIESHGGKLISKEYVNYNTKIEFQDKNGKIFYKTSGKIKSHKFK